MVSYRFIVFAGLAAALPLNINLGAYSPALVVGDGEISFGGRQEVSNLVNALEGAAVNAAAGAGAEGAGNANAAAAAEGAEGAANNNNNAANAAAEEATNAATAEGEQAQEGNEDGADPALTEQASQIASLQGLGKEIAPRDVATDTTANEKRDIAGFDRALTYAEAALVKGPKVQLGTGGEGAGVGIIVDNNPEAAARANTGAAEKRDTEDVSAPSRRAKVTTMYVRRGTPDSQGPSNQVFARELPAAAAAPAQGSSGEAIDAVNLNVDGDAGLTLTFVEQPGDEE